MTDNEKAASFIGWVFFQQDNVHWCGRDKDGHRAPDMSRPENYMRALAEVVEPTNWRDTFSAAVYFTLCGHTPHPVIKALVALYDAEHPKA